MLLRDLFVVAPILALVIVVAAPACSSDDDECCPVSEGFTCSNFERGGARSLQPNGRCEGPITDNIPKMRGKRVDAKGCTSCEPEPGAGWTCGVAPPRDASTPDARDADAANDANAAVDASDASAD